MIVGSGRDEESEASEATDGPDGSDGDRERFRRREPAAADADGEDAR